MNLIDARDEIKRYINKGLEKSDLVVLLESWGLGQDDLAKAYQYLGEAYDERSKNSEYYRFSLTDTGNAERLIRDIGDNLKYCPERKLWIIWDGKHWEWDDNTKIMALVKDTARGIYKEAAEEPDDDKRKEKYKHAVATESESRRRAMVNLAVSENGIPVKLNQIDNNDWLLNCTNGTINLKTGELQKHSKNDLISVLLPIEYQSEFKCELWLKFLDKITGGNKELIKYLQRSVGYSLTGDTREQCIFFLYGLGRNGKSTFISTIRKLIGAYGHKTNTEMLMVKDHNGGPKEDLADLKGKRFVVASEIEDGRHLAVVLIKEMTGGESIRADRKHEHAFEFTPTHKIWLSGNHKPIINDTTYSIWRRVKLIPFTITITDDECDPNLAKKLEMELPGILSWAVQGCIEWQKTGLGEPKDVIIATETYKQEQDDIRVFLEDVCTVSPIGWITKKDLAEKYKEWCTQNNQRAISRNSFREKLFEKGITEGKGTAGMRIWIGVTLQGDKGVYQPSMLLDTPKEDTTGIKPKEDEPF